MQQIIDALVSGYGFEVKPNHSLFWGKGSVANGETVTIRFAGEMATVTHHSWGWDGGDNEWDHIVQAECYIAQVWLLIPECVYNIAVLMARSRMARR